MRDIITKKTFNNIRKRFIDDEESRLTAKETVEIFNKYFRNAGQPQMRTLKELESHLISNEYDVFLVLTIYLSGVRNKATKIIERGY